VLDDGAKRANAIAQENLRCINEILSALWINPWWMKIFVQICECFSWDNWRSARRWMKISLGDGTAWRYWWAKIESLRVFVLLWHFTLNRIVFVGFIARPQAIACSGMLMKIRIKALNASINHLSILCRPRLRPVWFINSSIQQHWESTDQQHGNVLSIIYVLTKQSNAASGLSFSDFSIFLWFPVWFFCIFIHSSV
jgi:hypothetical protein